MPNPPDESSDPRHEVVSVSILRLPGNDDLALPAYQSEHAAGMDLQAGVVGEVTIASGGIALIPTGFSIAVPVGFEAQIRPRSGLALKYGISMPNTPGTIDADYRGQLQVPLINLGPQPFVVTRGMRIAQIIIKRVPRVEWKSVDALPPTQRGEGGFGHTGR
jgi:dUTP pyrophosphatase